MIFHSWEHRRRLRLALLTRNHDDFLQDTIRDLQKRERARTIAILDSTLALAILLVLGFTLVFIYTVNEDQIPKGKAFLLIMAVPFLFNVCQLFIGIVLLFITKRNSESHLEKCRQWCYMTKFLSALILFEFFILVQWHFRTLGFGLFGIQYLIRILAIHKVKTFMEELIVESHIVSLTATAAAAAAASIPLTSIVTTTAASAGPHTASSASIPIPELNESIVVHETHQLPTYSEALKQSSQYKNKDSNSTPPPSYDEVLLLLNTNNRNPQS